MTETKEGFTLTDLVIQSVGLEDRIKKIEADLKAPLEQTYSEQAVQLSHQMLLKRLLEIEKSNLIKVRYEIEKRKNSV